jgi:membrane protease YdiL (CAAX protease family)
VREPRLPGGRLGWLARQRRARGLGPGATRRGAWLAAVLVGLLLAAFHHAWVAVPAVGGSVAGVFGWTLRWPPWARITMALLLPLAQEPFFRGLALGEFDQVGARHGLWWTAGAFALVQGWPDGWFPGLCVGLALGWLLRWTGSLPATVAASVLFHALAVSLPHLTQPSPLDALGEFVRALGKCERDHAMRTRVPTVVLACSLAGPAITQTRPWVAELRGMVPLGTANTTAVALSDVDAEGDVDALVGAYRAPNRLWLNDGHGLFAEGSTRIPAGAFDTRVVATADVDRDGDVDAILGVDGQNRPWLNDGAGRFTDATSRLPAATAMTLAVALGDLDGDGAADALLGIGFGDARLWLNDGAGRFSEAPSRLPTPTADIVAVAIGDVDGDGDLDALLGNAGYPTSL